MLQTTLALGNNSLDSEMISGFLLFGIKGLFLAGMFIYFIFAIIIVRQIHIMKKTLITPVAPIVQTIGFAHLIIVGLTGLLFLLIL